MSSPVESVAPTALVPEARALMKRQGVHHLIVRNGRTIVGVLSARDLVGASPSDSVDALMSEKPVTATARTTIKEAANLMRGRAVGCLPVVDGSQVLGIVTISDLLELIGKGIERPIADITRRTLRARGPRKSRPSADRQGVEYTR
ncbi:MAG TPA: CBS domain-containing protein [Polyangia bacterium]